MRLTNVLLTNRRAAVMTIAVISLLTSLASKDGLSQQASRLEIRTLSSRPDLVSGGDALIEVKAPAGAQLNDLRLTLNDNDVTKQLRPERGSGGFRGLISGMVVGENTLIAKIKSP